MIPGSASPLLLKSAAAAAGYQIERSLRFNSNDSGFLSRTPAVAGSRTTWTWAGWIKRCKLGSRYSLFCAGSDGTEFFFEQSAGADKLHFYYYNNAASAYQGQCLTTAVFRDASAWYHIVLAVDTTQGITSNRCKIYVNGVDQATTFTTNFGPSASLDVNNTVSHKLGGPFSGGGALTFDGYLADIHFIDGQALTPAAFTEVSATTGQLIPKAYAGTYTGNSFWLKFNDNSAATATTLGKDSFLLGNNWTPNNLSVTAGAGNDSLVDTPTSYGTDTSGVGGVVRGNYCTWNPLDTSGGTLTNGNLDLATGTATYGGTRGTVSVSSGKWYWEVTPIAMTTSGELVAIGICASTVALPSFAGQGTLNFTYMNDGQKRVPGSSDTNYGATYTVNNVIGVALDLDAGTLVFYKDGSSQGTAFSSLSGSFTPYASDADAAQSCTVVANFGQRAFAYTAPSGFKALCDTNLGAPLVALPNQHFNAITYTGNGSTLTIPNATSTPTSIAFDPGFIWFKQRSSPKRDHNVYDVIRGTTKLLSTNGNSGDASTYDVYPGNGAEQTVSGLTAFNTGSKTVDVGSSNVANGNSASYIAWAWYGGATTAANTQGSITSQVRANVSAGFSVVTYTANGSNAATIGHGLGVKPSLIIHKQRTKVESWRVYHISRTSTGQFLTLNGTGGFGSSSDIYPAEPTSTVFTPGNEGSMNSGTENCVAYCFAPVVGYSSMGSYVGNGSSDGPFVYTGFRPRWVMIKRTDSTSDWRIYDSSRTPANPDDNILEANTSDSEDLSAGVIDILSNGLKFRDAGANNVSSGTYIYMAFAENPFQYARAR